jgi:hypothetical protein
MEGSSRHRLYYYDRHSILLVNRCGVLAQIHVPFRVRCINPVGPLNRDAEVYVQQISEDKKHRILYLVLDLWLPYHHFRLEVHT